MRIGVDLGGTKIEGVVLDARGTMRARRRVPTPRDDYSATLEAIASLVGELEREAGERGTVGIGMPGALSPATGVVKNANSVWLNRPPFDRDLSRLMGPPLRLANDTDCFSLAEALDGAAAGVAVLLGLIP